MHRVSGTPEIPGMTGMRRMLGMPGMTGVQIMNGMLGTKVLP